MDAKTACSPQPSRPPSFRGSPEDILANSAFSWTKISGNISNRMISSGITSNGMISSGAATSRITSNRITSCGITSHGISSKGAISCGIASNEIGSSGLPSCGITSGQIYASCIVRSADRPEWNPRREISLRQGLPGEPCRGPILSAYSREIDLTRPLYQIKLDQEVGS